MWGILPGEQQLAWLTAKIAPLEGHVEVDFPAERLGMVLTVRLSSGHTDRAAHESLGAASLRRLGTTPLPLSTTNQAMHASLVLGEKKA